MADTQLDDSHNADTNTPFFAILKARTEPDEEFENITMMFFRD